jgi:hypothetical protein
MRTVTFFVALLLVFLAVRPASAQAERPERPYRGLFGGGVGNTEQLLTFTINFGAGYDSDILVGQGGGAVSVLPVDPRRAVKSTFEQASTGLAYSLSHSRVGFSASAGNSASYYPALAQPLVQTQSASVGGSLQIASRTSVTASESATYGPLYFLTSFPVFGQSQQGQPVVLNETLGARVENHLALMTGVSFSQSLPHRVALTLSYARQSSHSPSGDFDLMTQSGGGGVSVGLAKGLSLQVGYGYQEGQFGSGATVQRTHDQSINAGLSFNRALSLSRRVTLSFDTGSSALSQGGQTHYGLTGDVRLTREIGRTWNATIGYSRTVAFLETFRQPVFSDSLGLSVGGLIARRLQFQSNLGAATGQVGFTQKANSFNTYYASAGLTIGLTRELGFGVDYSYARYFFGTSVALPSGLSRRMDRQRVFAHLSLWVPLVQRTRRPDAAR